MGQGEIIDLLKNHSKLTTNQIAEKLNKGISSTQVNLRKLREQKLIEMIKIRSNVFYKLKN